MRVATLVLSCLLCISQSNAFIDQTEVDSAWNLAVEHYRDHLKNLTINGLGSSRAKRSLTMTPDAEVMSDNSNIYSIYEDIMMKKHSLSKRQVAGTQTPAACQTPNFNCNGAANARYRNIDGTCNNLQNPLWGSRNRPFNRVARPAYEDNRNVPRGGFNTYLPNPRWLSTSVHFDSNPVNRQVTNMVPQFGQFLDHDITMTPEASSQCCRNPRSNVDCWAIPIPNNDPFYSRRGERCMDFTRSTTCSNGGVREQVNAITAFIDGSQIYGSDPQRTRQLRAFQGGRLATNPSLNGFLPSGNQLNVQVQGLFVAGDDRINVMPGLAVTHNVFLMEHNRIARELQQLTGSNNDELIFQETRRIMIAMLQNIVYSEYLPIILSSGTMSEYGLWLPQQGYSQYNRGADPTIFNSFATAAYRFGHSMIAGIVRLISGNNAQVGSYAIRDQYFRSDPIIQGNGQGYDLILRSLMTQNAPEMDRHCTEGVTNFLFKPQNQNFGSDLIARNIQRGRDHGLPSYDTFRQLCGLNPLTNWNQRPREINQDSWNAMANVYSRNRNSPQQIDLFTGGLSEMPVDGGVMGPTFQCLLGVQFQRLKEGDRYFFTHNTGPYAFSQAQIAEIRRQRLSDIVCRNSQQPDAPANAFLIRSQNNQMVPCRNRRPMDLRVFLN